MSTKIKFEHEAQEKEETYKAGQFFIHDREIYQLVQIEAGIINMINIEDGNRKKEALRVENAYNLSERQVGSFFSDNNWQRVSVEITTKPYKP